MLAVKTPQLRRSITMLAVLYGRRREGGGATLILYLCCIGGGGREGEKSHHSTFTVLLCMYQKMCLCSIKYEYYFVIRTIQNQTNGKDGCQYSTKRQITDKIFFHSCSSLFSHHQYTSSSV